MPQSPYKYLTDFYKGKTKRSNALIEYVHTQTDSFITWIIGFSFSGLLLLVSDLHKLTDRPPTIAIMICLFIAIVLGIVFRYISYLITIFQKSLDDYFVGLFSEELMTPIAMEDDIENMNFDELHRLINADFDEYIPYTFPLPPEIKTSEEPGLRKHYTSKVERSKQQFDFTLNHLAEIEETAYRVKKEITINAIQDGLPNNPKIGYNRARWFKIRSWLFTLCLASFLIAIFILCISLLIMLYK